MFLHNHVLRTCEIQLLNSAGDAHNSKTNSFHWLCCCLTIGKAVVSSASVLVCAWEHTAACAALILTGAAGCCFHHQIDAFTGEKYYQSVTWKDGKMVPGDWKR
jgi:hypothetical protein